MTDPFREQLQQALVSAYELDRELTGGGMSRVFVAREKALERTVVVKVLPPELAAGVNRERFRREIQFAAGLHHPHIVPLLNAGEVPRGEGGAGPSWDLIYYTMPYIEGESLRTALERRGALPVREVVRVLHDVVDALAYAHARGIVHRDIKPGNILLSGRHALVTDFGVAKALSAALPQAGMTTSGMAIGTPAYMAPEQLAGDPAADHRVDIYAAGLLAYELLTGASPFQGPSPQATMAAQLTRLPTPLSECCPGVPPALSAAIMRCLAKLPEERPQSAQTLLDELEGIEAATSGESATRGSAAAARGARAASGATGAAELPGEARDDSPPARDASDASAPDPFWREEARRATTRRITTAAVAVALLFAGVAAGFVARDRGRSPEVATLAAGRGVVPADSAADAGAPADPGAPGAGERAAGSAPRGREGSEARQRPQLTRADSLAIAEAVRREIERQGAAAAGAGGGARAAAPVAGVPPAPSIFGAPAVEAATEEARRALERVYFDSIRLSLQQLRRMRGPGVPLDIDSLVSAQMRAAEPATSVVVGGARRVLVNELRDGTPRQALRGATPALTDALRRALASEGDYAVPDRNETRAAIQRARTAQGAARVVGAGATITGVLVQEHDQDGEHVVVQLLVHDAGRGRPLGVVRSDPVSYDELADAVETAAERARELLDAAAWPTVRVVRPPPPPPAPATRRP